ncbi:hypothetical protein ACFPN4_00825 [Ureibacillus thermophilus]|uniref:Uncharacterized protein n=1 Tax=Ureibacillus thermophilus TaxID=367743 RepID=A0A4P6UW78_9BACL|nr:hypothetical protein [Ureibacillus thermophilus]QBK26278.1 hypothetical protein DKZ56_10620 [Ureibacillus thermophilus]
MESLIILILFGLIGSILSSKAKDRHNPSTPPPVYQNPQNRPKVEIKTFDEFAKEIYQQLTEKKEVQPKQEAAPKLEIQGEQPKIETSRKHVNMAKDQNPKPVAVKQNQRSTKGTGHSFLSSKEGLVNAIIAQEILGPPKAKKR